LDLSFVNIFNFLKLTREGKIKTNLDFLKYFNLDFFIFTDKINAIYEYIFKERFVDEIEIKQEENVPFDIFEDFDLLFANFKKYFNIDLIKDKNLSWFEFKFYLEDLLLTENSLTKRIFFRVNDESNIDKIELKNFYRSMKKKYNINHRKKHNLYELLKIKETNKKILSKAIEDAEWS